MITPKQVRAARLMLDWNAPDLARAARLNVNTVSRFETGGGVRPYNAEAIQRTLEQAGIRFLNTDEGEGIMLLRHKPS